MVRAMNVETVAGDVGDGEASGGEGGGEVGLKGGSCVQLMRRARRTKIIGVKNQANVAIAGCI